MVGPTLQRGSAGLCLYILEVTVTMDIANSVPVRLNYTAFTFQNIFITKLLCTQYTAAVYGLMGC